jgi:hypothetical protein
MVVGAVTLTAACRVESPSGPRVAPVYNQETGKLEQLVSDRDGDGRAETRAFMDGATLKRVEIDRNGDGTPDRWEFYRSASAVPIIDRAEEANGRGHQITRREFYAGGAIQRVEEDSDLDGRQDKWEWYDNGVLSRVELDLVGKGMPSQRLVYSADGAVVRVETDPDGDGKFVLMSASR